MLATGVDSGATGVPGHTFYTYLDGLVAVDPKTPCYSDGVLPHVLAACHRCSVPALNAALATAFALYLSIVAYTFGVMCAMRDSDCIEGF